MTVQQNEVFLYGSSRLGVRKFSDAGTENVRVVKVGSLFAEQQCVRPDGSACPTPPMFATRNQKSFELSNHLGNVLSVVSDQKVWRTEEGGYYAANVVSATDYYAFGMAIAGRKRMTDKYRYGFNGKENDADWGTEMIQDYGFRIYSPSIGRFFSVDPLSSSYPFYTPYQFAGNKPIQFIDIDGAEEGYTKAQMDAIIWVAEQGMTGKHTYEGGETTYLNTVANKWFIRRTSISGEAYLEIPVLGKAWKSFSPADASAEQEAAILNKRYATVFNANKDMNKALAYTAAGCVAVGATGGLALYGAGTGALAAGVNTVGVGLRHVGKLGLNFLRSEFSIGEMNLAAGASDGIFQLLGNGGKFEKVNSVSIAGNVFMGPFASAFLGANFNISWEAVASKKPLEKLLTQDVSLEEKTANVLLGWGGNVIGDKISAGYAKYLEGSIPFTGKGFSVRLGNFFLEHGTIFTGESVGNTATGVSTNFVKQYLPPSEPDSTKNQ